MIDSHGEVFLAHDDLKQYCKRSSFADTLAFILHINRSLQYARIQMMSRYLIGQYLEELYYNPSHPALWTNIDHRNELVKKTDTSVTDFKLMYSTLKIHRHLRDWIQANEEVIILHLVRKNLLKSYISRAKMKNTRIVHTKNENIRYSPVKINTDEMASFFESTQSRQNRYRKQYSQSRPYLELSYEEMFKSQTSTLSKILSFLRLPKEEIPLPRMKKISSSILSEEISNSTEVIERLKGIEHEIYQNDFSA